MYKLWFGLTIILVATAVQFGQTTAAASKKLPVVTPQLSTVKILPNLSTKKLAVRKSPQQVAAIPQVQPLPTVKKASPARLKQLQKIALANQSRPIQPLLSARRSTAGSYYLLGKYPLIALPKNFRIAQSQPMVKPLPVLKNKAVTSLDDLETTPDPASDSIKVLATQIGGASWYGPEGGPLTATGERYIPSLLTAAHRKLPFGTKVQVTNLRNNKSVIVRINDRGPFIRGRIIDLSEAAAAEVGIKSSGVGRVRLDILSYGDGRRVRRR